MATQTNLSMVSEVSICNQALLLLGQAPILSLNTPSATATWMNNNYPFIRDALLEMRSWSFAMSRAVSTSEDRDPWDIQYKHQIPLGWLKVERVYDDVSCVLTSNQADWQLEGSYVLSTQNVVYLYGIERITNTGKFSALFTQALTARLAADACIPLTENRQLQADLWSLYEDKLNEATSADGKQGRNERSRAFMLNSVR